MADDDPGPNGTDRKDVGPNGPEDAPEEDLTEEELREATKNATLIHNIHCLRRLLISAFRDAMNLSYRVDYELTSKQFAQHIKRKELPKLRLYIDNLVTAVKGFENAVDAKTERLVE